MSPVEGLEEKKPPAHLPSRRRIAWYYAECESCEWNGNNSPRAARGHSASEKHVVKETRVSLVEPE